MTSNQIQKIALKVAVSVAVSVAAMAIYAMFVAPKIQEKQAKPAIEESPFFDVFSVFK